MARKKRTIITTPAPVSETKDMPRYKDSFQQNVGKRVEDAGRKFEGHEKNILYGIAALVVLAIIVGIFYSWSGRSNAAAQSALGKAIETSQANLTDSPPPAGSTVKTYKTGRERAEAAIGEFQAVADKFGGEVGEKAKYFIAVNRLIVDRPAAIQELEAISESSDEVGKLAKFAVAQTRADDGKLDEATAIYQELAALADPIVAKDTINFELAKIYEKQGKKQEAVDLYFSIAKTASEVKDLDGQPVTLSPNAQSAKEKVQELDPERAKEIPEPASNPSFDGLPAGL